MTGSGNILQHGVYPCFNRWLYRCGTWNDFSLQILQVVAIEVKPALKRPIRHPPFALEEVRTWARTLSYVICGPPLRNSRCRCREAGERVNREMSLLRGEVSRGSGVGASLEPRREARDQACWRNRYRHDPSAGSHMSANLKHRGDNPPQEQQWGANVETRGELVNRNIASQASHSRELCRRGLPSFGKAHPYHPRSDRGQYCEANNAREIVCI